MKQYTVKCGAAPHPWRNNSDESNKREQSNNVVNSNEVISKWYTCKHIESERHIKTCQNTMKTDVPFKKLSNPYTIPLQRMCHLLRNLCTACSGTHSLILHTYTATYVHTYTATHIVPAQVYTHIYRCGT